MKLRAKYGDLVPEKGPIPAYLMGNIWAQDWSNLAPLVSRCLRRACLFTFRPLEKAQQQRRGDDPHR